MLGLLRDSDIAGNEYHTTHRLIEFCSEFHPEVDFDKAFETDQPGVFARYQEEFGHDYEEWVQTRIYEELETELGKKGYSLQFNTAE